MKNRGLKRVWEVARVWAVAAFLLALLAWFMRWLHGGSGQARCVRRGGPLILARPSMLRSSDAVARRDLGVAYPRRLGAPAHETASHPELARRLGGLLGCACDVDYEP